MLWDLIWADDSILGGRAPGMLSVIPIQRSTSRPFFPAGRPDLVPTFPSSLTVG